MQEIGITKTQKPFQRIAVVALGCDLVLVGIIGLFLPVVPGGFFIVAGALMLSPRCAWFRRALEQSGARFPSMGRTFMRVSAWFGDLPETLYQSGRPWMFHIGQRMGQRTEQSVQNDETLSGTCKVLIFDQDVEDLARQAEPFEAHGFEVYKCMSIETAMRCIEREELDFAFVDQVSPAFEGLRVVRHLVRYNLHTPFVVVARCKDALCYQQALALGALDYLEKPVPKAETNWIIDNYFGNSLKKLVEQTDKTPEAAWNRKGGTQDGF
jgi:CheY-like chemotaxis protein